MNIFILEDDKSRVEWFDKAFKQHNLTVTEFVEEAKTLLRENKYDVMFFDHDLGGEQMVSSDNENTGYQVAKMVKETKNDATPVLVHSYNPQGAQNKLMF